MGFDHSAFSKAIGVGLKILNLGDEEDHFKQLVDVLSAEGTDGHHHHIASPFFRQQVLFRQFLFDAIGGGSLFVDLVDRHNNRHFCRSCMADGFQGLRTHPIVCRNHQDGNVSDFGAPSTHGGERLVTRSVQEGELPRGVVVLNLDLVSTNVLGDATGFSRGDAGLTDRIEEAGLAVVDVAHDGDDRGTANEMLEIFLFDHLDGLLGRLFDIVLKHRHAEFLCHSFDGWHVQGLRDRGNDPLEEQGFDDFRALDAEHVSELLDREIVLGDHDHFWPYLLGLSGCTQLHRAATLTLTCGFLAPLPNSSNWLGRWLVLGPWLGGTGQAGG